MTKPKCVMTLTGNDDGKTVTVVVEWTPALDMKNDTKNHAGLKAAVFTMLESVSTTETQPRVVKPKGKKK